MEAVHGKWGEKSERKKKKKQKWWKKGDEAVYKKKEQEKIRLAPFGFDSFDSKLRFAVE